MIALLFPPVCFAEKRGGGGERHRSYKETLRKIDCAAIVKRKHANRGAFFRDMVYLFGSMAYLSEIEVVYMMIPGLKKSNVLVYQHQRMNHMQKSPSSRSTNKRGEESD
jgi:hypothetical protein